jgi:hypothetical protein
MLGFGGPFSTKSRRYSTTHKRLRAARRTWQRRQVCDWRRRHGLDAHDEETTLVIADLTLAGIGRHTTADAELATQAAARAREHRRLAKQERTSAWPGRDREEAQWRRSISSGPSRMSHHLRIPVETLYQWRRTRTGPPARQVGKHLRYDPQAVIAWFAEQAASMGHVQDRWYSRRVNEKTGKAERVRTPLYGTGMRYKVRYIDPEGTERSRTFPDRCKREAENFLLEVEAAKREGRFVDSRAGRVSFTTVAENWLKGQSSDGVTRGALRSRLTSRI